MKMWWIGVLALPSALLMSCTSPGGCSGSAVAVQMFNYTPDDVMAFGELVGTACGNAVNVPGQVPRPTDLFDTDLQAGQEIHYRAGNQATTCTVHERGVTLTYVRADYTFVGTIECSCGFEEYYDAGNSLDSCM